MQKEWLNPELLQLDAGKGLYKTIECAGDVSKNDFDVFFALNYWLSLLTC